MTKQPRVLTAQAFACLGKSSGSTALPVLTAMGLECGLLPTALLSTHTGFPEATFLPLTQQMTEIIAHWRKQDLRFDGMYLGYLAAPIQAALVGEVVEKLANPHCVVVVAPVMGDNGTPYRGFDAQRIAATRSLCRRATVLVPNLTEAALLLERDYDPNPDAAALETLLDGLLALGPDTVILTGIPGPDDTLGIAGKGKDGPVFTYFHEKAARGYFGTGDIFASVLTGNLVRGETPAVAARRAADFALQCIKTTLAAPDGRWYGTCYEQELWRLGSPDSQ